MSHYFQHYSRRPGALNAPSWPPRQPWQLPAAWLGYADGNTVRICAWCPPAEKELAEAEAKRLHLAVTHGICEACAQKMQAQLLGETSP